MLSGWCEKLNAPAASGNVIYAVGVSGNVRNKEALFVESFEDGIEIIDPASTALVADPSAYFTDTLLYLEGQLQRSLP